MSGGEDEQQKWPGVRCFPGGGGVGRHDAEFKHQPACILNKRIIPTWHVGFVYLVVSRLVLVPGVQLADQYESDVFCCCHEGQRSQCFSGKKAHESEKQLFKSAVWYSLDHFGYFWSLSRVNSATNSKV